MKAFIRNASGLQLVFGATGMAPRLFFEWFPTSGATIKATAKYADSNNRIYSEWFDGCYDVICVRIENATRQTYLDAKEYINSNT